MCCWCTILGIGVAALVATLSTAAQDPVLKTRPKPGRNREYLASHRMTMNVQVSDAGGNPVPNLEAGDFALYDDNQLRKIAGFHQVDGRAMNDATSVVILLDAVNSSKQALDVEREGIFKYLAREHGPLPYPVSFVLWFNGHLKSTAPTTDRNAVGRAFVSLTKGLHSNACAPVDASVAQAAESGGPGALGDSGVGEHAVSVAHCLEVHYKDSLAALDGIAQQQKTLGGRTILIWVGPGWPVLKDVAFQRATLKAKQGYFEETVSLLHDLREAQMTLDVISPEVSERAAEMSRVNLAALNTGATSAQDAGPDSLALQIVARQTGGRVLNDSEKISDELASCIHDADVYYALTFEMMPGRTPHELHPLAVKVNRPGVQVRTVAEYYAEP
jgi:VWFA-related protein